MKFYSLAIASSFAYASSNNFEAARCPANLPCNEAIDSLVKQSLGRRRRRDTNTASYSTNKAEFSAIIDNTAVVCNNANKDSAECQTQPTVAPRFGLKVRVPVINNYGCWCWR